MRTIRNHTCLCGVDDQQLGLGGWIKSTFRSVGLGVPQLQRVSVLPHAMNANENGR
jgi:hypothetical protein